MIVDTVLLTKGLRAEFNRSYLKSAAPKYEPIITRINSAAASEQYGWLGSVPQMREWIGEKTAKFVNDYDYTIVNKKFESTIAVDEDEIDDDQIGAIMPRVRMLSDRARKWPNIMCSDLVINGTTNLAYDGSAYFADRAVNDNLLAGSGVTEANILTDLATARAAMLKFVDDFGELVEVEGDTIVCPAELEVIFQRIVESQTYVTATNEGVVNKWAGTVKTIIVDARLTDANDWYLFAANQPLKPLIYQNRKAPQFVAMDSRDSEHRFFNGKLFYSAEMRGNAGYGFPQFGVKTVNT